MIDNNVEAVRAKLLKRSQVGIAKYGTTTERGDLSPMEWLNHLQEELMDACVYLEAAMKAGALGETQQPAAPIDLADKALAYPEIYGECA
jgi:hypothetical protein